MQGYLKPDRIDLTIRQKNEYFYSYCGLCQQLKEDYGTLARFLVNRDALILQLLTEAQMKEPLIEQNIRCGVKLKSHLTRNHPKASKFAAAVAIMMAWGKLTDKLIDTKGIFDFPVRTFTKSVLLLNAKKLKKAEKSLKELDFDFQIVYKLFAEQQQLEKNSSFSDLEEITTPTAKGVSALFGYTALLANQSENIEKLKSLGKEVGAIVYILDAINDFEDDIKRHRFNPLCFFPSCQLQTKLKNFHVKETIILFLNKKYNAIVEVISNLKLYYHKELIENIFMNSLKNYIISPKIQQQTKRNIFFSSIIKSKFAIGDIPCCLEDCVDDCFDCC